MCASGQQELTSATKTAEQGIDVRRDVTINTKLRGRCFGPAYSVDDLKADGTLVKPGAGDIESNDAFNPSNAVEKDGGEFKRQLPESVYSAVIVCWLNGNGGVGGFDGFVSYLLFMGPPLALAASYVFQVGLAVYMLGVVQAADDEHGGDLDATCGAGSGPLRLLGVYLITGMCVKDLLETYDMHLWLQMFEHADKHKYLKLQKFEDTSVQEGNKASNTARWAEGTTVHRPVTGITTITRLAFYLFVIVGKLAVLCLVLAAGGGLVLRASSNYDLVLNCVAAGFILEIDEFAYALLVTSAFKNVSSGLPPLGLTYKETGAKQCRYWTSSVLAVYLIVGLVVALVSALYAGWCR